MNTNAYRPLYEYLDNIIESNDPDIVAAVSYSNLLDELSMALIDYRIEHNLNQTQFADFLSCSQSLVSAYENGARNISAEKMCELMAKIGKKVKLCFEDVSVRTTSQFDDETVYPDSKLNDQDVCAYAS